MVGIYFDKAFIKSFGERTDLSHPVVHDFFNQFIKKIRGVKVYLNIDSLNELNDLIHTNEFIYLLSEISPINLSEFRPDILNKEFFNDGPITKLFFVENCDENHLQNVHGCYFISNKSLKEKWKIFLSDREDNELIIKSNPKPSEIGIFHSWKDLNLFAHKIKNILVFDLYVMVNKKNQMINKNLLPCITELMSKDNIIEELTIFTKELGCNKKKNELHGLWQENDLNNSTALLSTLSGKIQNISFVKYDETKNISGDSEHNRFILTNYFFIRVEAGFNVFKDKTGVNNRDTIKFDSLLKNRTRNIVIEALKNIKQYTLNLKQKDTKAIGPGQTLEHYYYSPQLNCKFLK